MISAEEQRIEQRAVKESVAMIDGKLPAWLYSDMCLPHDTIDDDTLEWMIRDTANGFHCEHNSAVARVLIRRLRKVRR